MALLTVSTQSFHFSDHCNSSDQRRVMRLFKFKIYFKFMMHKRASITFGPNGLHLAVRSLGLARSYRGAGKLPSCK